MNAASHRSRSAAGLKALRVTLLPLLVGMSSTELVGQASLSNANAPWNFEQIYEYGTAVPEYAAIFGIPGAMSVTNVRLSPDGREMIGVVSVAGKAQMAVTSRAGYGSPFGAPVLIQELVEPSEHRVPLCLTSGGLRLFFVGTDRIDPPWVNPPTYWHVRESTRMSLSSPWTVPQTVFIWSPGSGIPQLTSHSHYAGSATDDGLELFLTGGTPAGGGYPPCLEPYYTATFSLVRSSAAQPFSAAASYTPSATGNPCAWTTSAFVSPDGFNLITFSTTATAAMWARSSRTSPWTLTGTAPCGASPCRNGSYMTASAGLREILFWRASCLGEFWLHRLRFNGAWSSGRASASQAIDLTYTNLGALPGTLAVGALALGWTPGFAVGSHVVPLNPDGLFAASVGGFPGVTTGYLGALDARNELHATLGPVPVTGLGGLNVWTAFVSVDAAVPGLIHVSNPVSITLE